MWKDHRHMLKILWTMLEFDEWQIQNHVSLQTVKVGHYTKKEKKRKEKKSPHCDLDHEDSKTIFLHDTLAHDDASPYFWLQKFKCFGDSKWRLKNLHCEHSNLFTRHSSLMMVYHPSPKSLHWQFRRYDRNSHALSTGVTLTIHIMIRSAGDGGNI